MAISLAVLLFFGSLWFANRMWDKNKELKQDVKQAETARDEAIKSHDEAIKEFNRVNALLEENQKEKVKNEEAIRQLKWALQNLRKDPVYAKWADTPVPDVARVLLKTPPSGNTTTATTGNAGTSE